MPARLGVLLWLFARGRVDAPPLTTHTFGFGEVERAFRMMEAHADGIVKPLIRFP